MDFTDVLGGTAAAIAAVALAAHGASAALAARRLKVAAKRDLGSLPAVTIIRPVCGLDAVERETLASTFRLPGSTEIIFCAARESDAAVGHLRGLITQNPRSNARLLIGQDGPAINPKLDNVRKGWRAATNDWVVIADSNVLIDDHYLWNMMSAWRDDTGAVCAPPFATSGIGVWAGVETQFLNSYQARWQYAADAVGLGFAQGKSMLFRKSQLDGWGGIAALDIDVAEDAATTKVVRGNGCRVRLAADTIPQPLGSRSLSQVWQRQCRWAQLRRQSFPMLYVFEPLTMHVPVAAAAVAGAASLGMSPLQAVSAVSLGWVATEALLAYFLRWPLSIQTLYCAIARDLMVPFVWLAGWRSRPFTWRQPLTTAPALQPA